MLDRGPAYRIVTSRLVLRCWKVADAGPAIRAITASLEHLRPTMPWVKDEPETLEQKQARFRDFRERFDRNQDFVYGVFDPLEREVLGGCGLHARIGPGGLEIGYWIAVDHIGRGYATELSAALTRVAFEINGVERVEIRCGPDNPRSAAIPRKLGFTHETTLKANSVTPEGQPRDTMVWVLRRDDYPGSPSAAASIVAYDGFDQPIALP